MTTEPEHYSAPTRDSQQQLVGHLEEIAGRHTQDRWWDAWFIVVAVLFTALSIGAVTTLAAGTGTAAWTVSVVESNLEIQR